MLRAATALDRYGRRRHAKDCNGIAPCGDAMASSRGTRKAKAWLGDAWDRMQGKGMELVRTAMAKH